MNELPEYKLERLFNAPRHLVWRTWTDPELLNEWYGPGAEPLSMNLIQHQRGNG